MALAAGATPDRISFGNTIKKERDIARAFALGVRLFAVDCSGGRKDRPRRPRRQGVLPHPCDGAGAEWPLSRKFGCEPEMAVGRAGARPSAGPGGLWHVVPCRLAADATAMPGTGALASAAAMFRDCAERGINLPMVNLGGGFPTKYLQGRAGGRSLRQRRSSGRCASISATASRRPSSSRAAAWSAMPA